jgi:glutamate/tyrosine decarboxylase-like PLP-dependent enzyme
MPSTGDEGELLMLMLNAETRAELWRRLIRAVEDYASEVVHGRVTPELNPEKVRALLKPFDFGRPLDPLRALDLVVDGLTRYQTHTPHPRYYGLFNPAPTTMGIAADTLVAAFNPQVGAWGHSPFATEVEQHLVRTFGQRFGYEPASTDGTFTSGGSEANHTALLTALVWKFPAFAEKGVRGLLAWPVLYASAEYHHSFLKAARLSGLGTDAVHEIPVDGELKMDVKALAVRIAEDKKQGLAPFLVVGTAGTTNAGVVEPLGEIAEVAAREGLWFHADAAWGGAAVLLPELRGLFQGIERADSITFDAHKWLSVPMGAGIYLTRHRDILEQTFSIVAGYAPREAEGLDVVDFYKRSMQWSRRFIGLKVFLSLAVAGWEGYEAAARHMVAMGERLREKLGNSSWEVVNRTPLPLVCFVDSKHPQGRSPGYLQGIVQEVITAGEAWISTTRLANGAAALRACITNYRTGLEDVQALVDTLNQARKQVGAIASATHNKKV